MGELLLGIDIGTTGTKVTLFDPDTGVVASASEPVALHSGAAGWAEADTDAWWVNLCRLVPAVTELAGIAPSEIKGVAATGMVPAVVAVDAHGKALRRAILQNDSRAVAEIEELKRVLDARRLRHADRTGSALTQQSVAPTLLWLARHEPEVTTDATAVVGSYDWMAIALGAELHVESNWALESGLYELSGTSRTKC